MVENNSPLFFESVIIKFIFTNAEIRDKLIPYLSPKLFNDKCNVEIVKKFVNYHEKFDTFPTISEMKLEIDNGDTFKHLLDVKDLDVSEYNHEYLLSEIEDFFKKQLINNAIIDASLCLSDNKLKEIGDIPDIMREALAFSFDTNIGLDFLNDAERLYDSIHNKDKVVPSGITQLDRTIQGGFHEKALHLFFSESNLGKTVLKCSFATNALLQNKNVLYITLEMSEERISERIMANLFDHNINELDQMSKEQFIKQFETYRKKIEHSLIIKEYPTKSINVNHIRNLLKELKVKKNFTPDIIFVDYLGIMCSTHSYKSDNTYTEAKRISEELRGLAVETEIAFVSSYQSNRSGYGNSELELDNTADSIGIVATADLIIAITQPDEFKQMNKLVLQILKTRFGIKRKLYVLIDIFKMRISDDPDQLDDTPILSPSQQAQNNINQAVNIVNTSLDKDNKSNFNKIINFDPDD